MKKAVNIIIIFFFINNIYAKAINVNLLDSTDKKIVKIDTNHITKKIQIEVQEIEYIYEYDTIKTSITIQKQDTIKQQIFQNVDKNTFDKLKVKEPIYNTKKIKFYKSRNKIFSFLKRYSFLKNLNPIWSINIWAASQYNTNKISINNNLEQNNDFANKLKSSDLPRYTFAAGADISAEISKFTYKIGVNYSEVGENFNYTTLNSNYTIKSDTLDRYYKIVNGQQTWFYVIKNTTINQIDTLQQSIKNSYKYIEIPISLGYKINSNKLYFLPSISLVSAFLFDNKAKTYEPNNLLVIDIEKKMLNKFVLYYSASFDVGYEFNQNIGIFLSPYFKRNINPSFLNQNYYNKKYTNYGLKIGINLKL